MILRELLIDARLIQLLLQSCQAHLLFLHGLFLLNQFLAQLVELSILVTAVLQEYVQLLGLKSDIFFEPDLVLLERGDLSF